MTNRPGPRKSTLAGSTPTAPSTPAAESPSTPAAAAPASEKKKAKPKVSFYQEKADTERARAAWFHTQVEEGARSWSQFIEGAVTAEVERLEAKYNGGREWEGIGSKELPLGRPAGS